MHRIVLQTSWVVRCTTKCLRLLLAGALCYVPVVGLALENFKEQPTAFLCYEYAKSPTIQIRAEIIRRGYDSPVDWKLIDAGTIATGMDFILAACVLGEPESVESDRKRGTSMQHYRNNDGSPYFVQFRSGKIISVHGANNEGRFTKPSAPNPVLPSDSSSLISSGTCFFVSPQGRIITNYHVVKEAGRVEITDAAHKTYDATVARIDTANDLALLEVAASAHAYINFAESAQLRVGDRIFTFGYPVTSILGNEPKYTDGTVSALSGYGDTFNVFQMTVSIQPGNSGGPVVDADGTVVGVATSSAAVAHFIDNSGAVPQNVNWAVKGEYAKILINDAPPHVQKLGGSARQAIERTRNALCRVKTFGR